MQRDVDEEVARRRVQGQAGRAVAEARLAVAGQARVFVDLRADAKRFGVGREGIA